MKKSTKKRWVSKVRSRMKKDAKRCLYLVSSSASREYVADCLEALALPRGMIMHFRYRLRYADDDLVKSLPEEGGKLRADLQNLPVVVVYVYQTQASGIWKPVETEERGGPYLPLRCGRLINAFKDGVIAHFFFEVTGYVKEDEKESNRKLLNQKVAFKTEGADSKTRTKFAHMSEDLNFDSPPPEDTEAFQSILDNAYWPNEWRTRSLGSAPLDVTYEIVSFRISGVFHKKEQNRLDLVNPTPQAIGSNVYSAYQLESGGTYHLRLATHLPYRSPAALPGQGQVTLKLDFNPDLITPLGPTRLRVNSFYDLEYWSFVVTKDQGQSTLTVTYDNNVAVDRSEFQRTEVLCPEMSLPILISSGESPGKRI